MQRRHAPNGSFGQRAFDRSQAKDLVVAQSDAEGIDQSANIDIRAVCGYVTANDLPFSQGFHPRRRERRGLDAEPGVDQYKPFGQQLSEMSRLAIWARQSDPDRLRQIVNAHEHQIEAASADAPDFQIAT
jgi:hypothetical protein